MFLSTEEEKKIEEWTQKKVGYLIFNSDVDDWNRRTSAFDEKLLSQKNVLFIVEDTKLNKFGYYYPGVINELGRANRTENCFLFILRSNGRFDEMLKFDQLGNYSGLEIRHSYDKTLFGIIAAFWVDKEKYKKGSYWYYEPHDFDYLDHDHPLGGKGGSVYFTPKRIVVFGME